MLDLLDPEYQERLASEAYYTDRQNEVILDREHDLDPDARYFCLEWESVSDASQRPYRTAVALTCAEIARELEAA